MSVILTFLGEFEIVTTGFAIVDFQSQLLITKGVRFAQMMSWKPLSKVLLVEKSVQSSNNFSRIRCRLYNLSSIMVQYLN